MALLAMISTGVYAQNNNPSNNSNTPYSRYGYGRLAESTMLRNRAMGGIEQGIHSNQQINPGNPASYTAIDSLTFLFDFGLKAGIGRFSEGGASQSEWDGGLDYLSMQFPMGKYLAGSAGLMPYSYVGYGYGSVDSVKVSDDTYYAEKRYFGTGGLSKAYLGFAGKPFPWISLGVNAAYVFGEITNDYSVIYPNNEVNSNYSSQIMTVRALELQFGVQLMKTFKEKHHVVLGATFTPKLDFRAETEAITTLASSTGNTNVQSDTTKADFTLALPQSLAVGVTYTYDRRLTLGADFEMINWSDVDGLNDLLQKESNLYQDVYKFDLGGEYVHKLESRRYLDRIRYRAGLNYAKSYVQVDGSQNKELGLSLGLGLPLKNQKSMVNFSFEYIDVRPENKSFLKENYFQVNLGLTFNEFWFFQNKLK